MPSFVKPLRVATSASLTQLYRLSPIVWCVNPSNCVPTWPISENTISSLLPRRFEPAFMFVRFTSISNRRPVENGMSAFKRAPKLEHLAGADQSRRAQHRFRLHVIACTALVGRTPLRRTALGVRWRSPGLAMGE